MANLNFYTVSMKKIIYLFCFLISINAAFSQSDSIDFKLQNIAAEKDDNKRVDLINDLFMNTSESNPELDMQNAEKLLSQSRKTNDRIAEALALSTDLVIVRLHGGT